MNPDKKTDPLAALISSDAKAVDRAQLAELLGPFMVIDQNSKDFGFLPALREVDGNGTKIEILLAGAKARALYFNLPDGLLPMEIIAAGLMPEGSVKTSLKKLFDAHVVNKDKKGRYFLPAHHVADLFKRLNSK